MTQPVQPQVGYQRLWQLATIGLAILVVGILGVAAWNDGTLWVQSPSMVDITGITLNVEYIGNRTGYLGPPVQNECGQCPISLEEGSTATFRILRLYFNSSGPSAVYITTTVQSTYPFLELGYLLSNPPLVTSQAIHNVSYLAGSQYGISPSFEIPTSSSRSPAQGNITITVEASPTALPNS